MPFPGATGEITTNGNPLFDRQQRPASTSDRVEVRVEPIRASEVRYSRSKKKNTFQLELEKILRGKDIRVSLSGCATIAKLSVKEDEFGEVRDAIKKSGLRMQAMS